MIKPILSIVLLGFSAVAVQAQDVLEVQGTSPSLYITHTVKKGENFYSLSRAYGVPPKEIATVNNVSMDQGLQLGKQVNIPLTTANFSQKNGAAGKPVYHKVSDKETLYRVSVNYNKVAIDNIRSWNNLSGDGLKKDTYIIIGYLKAAGAPPDKEEPVVAKVDAPKEKKVVQERITTDPYGDGNLDDVPSKSESKPQPATESEPASSVVVAPPAPVPAASNKDFEQLYMEQTSNGKKAATEKGPGTWFKSNAVNKYYALHNTAPRGTIIKVTNPLNGKSIYAKVLDVIPQIKPNAGLIIKLSDAAMEALGSNETKFYCELSYEN
ncbi:LysM peptidoglycan-binding domain-containing protein [Chitinophaga silvatica]|uniref:LysM peptidoglycan-binding domain-containing protein n=1 Tax=Chitinophaga silvatica TaxID=2282649 RepID=A0A3E1Y5G3_9BACT|nr:LysM peptidoglycan-binding domain-containing protein [Chitinophaga silvatica]RFS19737.1 LysM peptidoglycan-binding domain-containing protein [Chitinophaga silvatica]